MNALRKFLRADVHKLDPLPEGPLAPEVEAPREAWWGKPHCDYCAIARTHAPNCFCGNCGIAAQHVADQLKARGLEWVP